MLLAFFNASQKTGLFKTTHPAPPLLPPRAAADDAALLPRCMPPPPYYHPAAATPPRPRAIAAALLPQGPPLVLVLLFTSTRGRHMAIPWCEPIVCHDEFCFGNRAIWRFSETLVQPYRRTHQGTGYVLFSSTAARDLQNFTIASIGYLD